MTASNAASAPSSTRRVRNAHSRIATPAKERAVAEQRGQQGLSGGGGAPAAGQRGAVLVFRLGKGRPPGRQTERQTLRIRRPRQPITIRGEMRR